ncbi:hypothetical protein ACR77J_07510 [Tissierella praeacuta]|uniref:hypothetical protein n=1 Tax=Tissierella praeacuta TaxID=43131 RepID=UPI003DA33922
MNYQQIDRALSFLDKNNRSVILQVPYEKDVKLVIEYILCKYSDFKIVTRRHNTLCTSDFEVKIESVYGNKAGYGYQHSTFFIDRHKDFSYYEWLEVE